MIPLKGLGLSIEFSESEIFPKINIESNLNQAMACPENEDCDLDPGDSGGGVTCPAWGTNYGSCHRRHTEYHNDGNGNIWWSSECVWTGYQSDYC